MVDRPVSSLAKTVPASPDCLVHMPGARNAAQAGPRSQAITPAEMRDRRGSHPA